MPVTLASNILANYAATIFYIKILRYCNIRNGSFVVFLDNSLLLKKINDGFCPIDLLDVDLISRDCDCASISLSVEFWRRTKL